MQDNTQKDIESVLISRQALRERVAALGEQISRDYAGKELVLVGILKGSVVFLSDLMRAIDLPVSIDFMAVSSYGAAAKSSGVVRISKDLDHPIKGKHVLVVEDILDSGRTLRYIMKLMAAAFPASLEICTLLDKPERRIVPIECRYTGFAVPDEFVVGYGLDYAEKYRNLPYIGVLSPSVYADIADGGAGA